MSKTIEVNKKICHVLQTDYIKKYYSYCSTMPIQTFMPKTKAIAQMVWIIGVNREIGHVLHTDIEKILIPNAT